MSQVAPGDRAYVKSDGLYGEVTRTNVLNLPHAPLVLKDSGKYEAFFGPRTTEVVNKSTASDGITTIELPVDVKLVGIDLLTAHGTDAATQTLMFENFVNKLTRAQRDQYAAAFKQVDPTNAQSLSAFLDSMIQTLTAL